MIYLVTNNRELFETSEYTIIGIEESLKLLNNCGRLQFDTETSGRDPHVNDFLCIQFGNDLKDIQIVIDTTTVNILNYKEILETHLLIGQNLKFDLAFLYNYNIIPRNIYDTMIVEQLLYLGYPKGSISYSLKEIAFRRLNIDIDKTVRGEIIWRGLDSTVIKYAAGDITYLEKIMESQIKDLQDKDLLKAAALECNVVPAITYIEWCGILLSTERWQEKINKDQENLQKAEIALNNYVTTLNLSKYTTVNYQGDLFSGFDLSPKCNIDWNSPKQVISFCKDLGFNTSTTDKKTGEDKDSVVEKLLNTQKGIDDTFLSLYFKYKEYQKVTSTYGQGHLNSINPNTGRLHTVFWQLGTISGRMSCGSNSNNSDLEKLKKLPKGSCTYPNLQQLPADVQTRSSFVAPKGYKFVSADFSAEEARLGGDIYQDAAILDMFRNNIDSHSMYAKIFFKEELKDVDVKDVKKLRPDLRQKAKGPEFALSFGGGYPAIMQAINCSKEEAEQIIKNYEEGFSGTAEFAKKGSKFLRERGYVLINPITGHKMFWWDFKQWKDRQNSFTKEFWEDYKKHKGTGDSVENMVKMHFKAAAKWDRMVRNGPCQGTGAIIMKTALTELFNWIVLNNYFNIVHICCCVHDEICCDYPETIVDFPKLLEKIMENAAAKYCKSLPIPAVAEVGDCWIH